MEKYNSMGSTNDSNQHVNELWFEQFKQIAWLSTAAAGFSFGLVSSKLLNSDFYSGLAIVLFCLSSLLSVLSQVRLVDSITFTKPVFSYFKCTETVRYSYSELVLV